MAGIEISNDGWKAIGGGLITLLGVFQALIWRLFTMEKQIVANDIKTAAEATERAAEVKVRELENEFRNYREDTKMQIGILEAANTQSQKRFDEFDRKLDVMRGEISKSNDSVRADISSLRETLMGLFRDRG